MFRDERRRAILCHELLHVRRRDWFWVIGEELALTALWFGLVTGVPGKSASAPFTTPGLAEGLMKLATVMILGGIVASLLARDAAAPPPGSERSRDVPPSA